MSLSTLANTKWLLNNSIQFDQQYPFQGANINFVSNSTLYSYLDVTDDHYAEISYGTSPTSTTIVYTNSAWVNSAYRTVYFIDGTDIDDASVIDWVELSGTQIDVDIEAVNTDALDGALLGVADAIRAKSGGSSTLTFPSGFVSEVNSIVTGGITINGAVDIPSILAQQNISAGDTCYILPQKYTKYLNPDTLPKGVGNGCAWSPDGTRLAVAHATSPYITIYNTTTNPYTKLTNPSTLPAGTGKWCAWSPDGTRLAVAHVSSPRITIYDTTTTPYTKLTNPSTLPTGDGYGCMWSPNGRYLAVAHDTSPYITVYDTTTTPYTKLTDPTELPKGRGFAAAWNPDGSRLAIAHNTSPYVTIYNTATSPYTKLTNPSTLPKGNSYGCAWSPNGAYLVVTHTTSPYMTVYDTTTNPYSKIANPSTLLAGVGKGCAWSPDGTKLALAHYSGTRITIYNTTSIPYTKWTNPLIYPSADGYGCGWSPDGKKLTVGFNATPYEITYCISDVSPSCVLANNARSAVFDMDQVYYGYAKTDTMQGGNGQAVALFYL